ncbi:MAG: glycosyltransferase [Myxococcales bacterium]|nr:glycosyltransferase [Myxococcales bacterium]MDD9972025.1 glycosyltransferase [Myxococcales bacterium]
MAKIVLTTFGSHGDLFPYLAIAEQLRSRGHEAIIAAPERYRVAAGKAGAVFFAVRPDVVDDPEISRRAMERKRGSEVVVREWLVPRLRESYQDLAIACEGADLVVSHVLTYAGPILAETRGLPWLSTVLAPMVFFSAHDPPALAAIPWFARLRPLGPRVVGALSRGVKRVSWSWSEPIRNLRRELGLPADKDPLWDGHHSPHGVLALFSSALAERQPDWPKCTTVCGFPFYDEDFGDAKAELLGDFLAAGPPPLVFCLGSSTVHAPGNFYEVAARAAGCLGCRAVLLTGDAAAPHPLPDGVLAIRSANVYPLFEACSVVVHPGGIGTTAQALRAGRPQLLIPYAHDQFDNARRVTGLGVGRTLHRKDLDSVRLSQQLASILSDSVMRAKVLEKRTEIRAENGTSTACDVIESRL